MKRKAPYPGMTKKEYKELLRKSKVVLSFVGEKYVKQSKSMIREIEEQHRRNDEKLTRDNKVIGSGFERLRKR